MNKSVRLSIPTPCSEKWESFAPTTTGGLCSSCSKNVIDFTKMTDAEVVDFLKSKPTRACGRFRDDQLKEYVVPQNYTFRLKPSRMLLKAGMISLFFALINKPSFAQTTSAPAKTEVTSINSAIKIWTEERIIKGVVMDPDSLPMPGVNVILAGTSMGTVTDVNGKFEFPQRFNGGTLIISSIAYETAVYTVTDQTSDVIQITLKYDLSGTCETVLLGRMGEIATDDVFVPSKGLSAVFASIKKWFR